MQENPDQGLLHHVLGAVLPAGQKVGSPHQPSVLCLDELLRTVHTTPDTSDPPKGCRSAVLSPPAAYFFLQQWQPFPKAWYLQGMVERDEAFGDFVRAESDGLFRVAVLLTGQRHSAQDLVQETLVRVYVHWPKAERADAPRAYVRRMLTNRYLRQRRSERDHLRGRDGPEADPMIIDAGFSVVEARDQVNRGLQQLPPRQRTAIVLRHYEHMTEKETASAMHCSVGTVKSLTSRGLRALRAHLAEPDSEGSSR